MAFAVSMMLSFGVVLFMMFTRTTMPKYRRVREIALKHGCVADAVRVENKVYDNDFWQEWDLPIQEKRALNEKRLQEVAVYQFELNGKQYRVMQKFRGGDVWSPKQCKVYWEPGNPEQAITEMNREGGVTYALCCLLPFVTFILSMFVFGFIAFLKEELGI